MTTLLLVWEICDWVSIPSEVGSLSHNNEITGMSIVLKHILLNSTYLTADLPTWKPLQWKPTDNLYCTLPGAWQPPLLQPGKTWRLIELLVGNVQLDSHGLFQKRRDVVIGTDILIKTTSCIWISASFIILDCDSNETLMITYRQCVCVLKELY